MSTIRTRPKATLAGSVRLETADLIDCLALANMVVSRVASRVANMVANMGYL